MLRAHHHDELEVNLVLRGWAEYLVGGRRARLTRSALAWLLPTQPHRLIDQSADLRMWIGVFRPILVRNLGRDGAGPPERWLRAVPADATIRLVDEHAGRLGGLFAQLAEPDTAASRHRAGLTWLLSECWDVYCRARSLPEGVHLHPAVERAARWLHDHAAEPEADDLAALADACGVSRPWLSTLFSEQIGVSITDFRNRQRLRRFREHLADRRCRSATDAAYAAGFGSYTQCFRVVRNLTGQSPRTLWRDVRG